MMSDDDYERKPPEKTRVVKDGGKPLVNRVFKALANQRRRYILYYLRDHEQAELEELAIQIAACEHDIPRDEVSTADAEAVRKTLIHSHLPKLADYGLVEYDQRSGAVTYTHPPSLLDDVLDLAATIERPS